MGSEDGAVGSSDPATPQDFEHNAILRGFHGEGLTRALKDAAIVHLKLRDMIYASEETIRDVYFPIDAVLSVVTRMKEGGIIEVGTVGREGCSAIPLLMGAGATANDCYCQVPGTAVKLDAKRFHELRVTDVSFRARLDRYLQGYVNFLGQLAGCNRLHSVYERCSRWLLLTHDRVGRNNIALTHEYLAMMLGSRRSGVSIALSTLRRAGYISYTKGSITVVDRQGLEDTTCECYAVARAQFGSALREGSGDNVVR